LNRKGFTVTELLIYIALLGLVSLLIGKQFKSLTDNYAKGKQVSRQQSDARDVVTMISREIRNTGLKVYLQSSGTDSYTRVVAPGVINGSGDSSSFTHTQGDPGDGLTILKAHLSSAGALLGIDTVHYYLEGNSLRREYRTAGSSPAISTIAENIYALQFRYGILGSSEQLLDETPLSSPSVKWSLTNQTGTAPSRTDQTNSITLSFTAAATGRLEHSTSFSVTADSKYAILLMINAEYGFPKQLDSLRFAFRNTGGVTIASEPFLPWCDSLWITVPVPTTSAQTYATIDYHAKGAGTLTIKGIEVKCIESGVYTWSDNPSTSADKKNVRAIRMYMLIRSDQKAAAGDGSAVNVGEISVSRSADYAWRLYTETIETPNNGIF